MCLAKVVAWDEDTIWSFLHNHGAMSSIGRVMGTSRRSVTLVTKSVFFLPPITGGRVHACWASRSNVRKIVIPPGASRATRASRAGGQNAPKMAILRVRRVLGNQSCRPTCIWALRGTSKYLNGTQEYSPGAQIHVGLQN